MDAKIDKGLKQYRTIGYKGLKKQFKEDKRQEQILRYYKKRHAKIAASEDFGENNYKLHFMSHVITILACHQTLLHFGYSKEESCKKIREIQKPMGMLAHKMYDLIDWLPFGYRIIRWSLMKDMTGELGKNFVAEFPNDDENGFSYIVKKCVYVDTFRRYGYPELIRVCCDNDIWCFNGLHRHVKWTRKCNVGDQEGIGCYDVFEKVKKK